MEQKYDIQEYTSKTGLPTIRINGYFIHSKYNPQKEAADFVEKNFKPGYIHILFGYGLGYIADELVNRLTNEEEKLIIVEPILKDINNSNKKIKILLERDMNKLKDTIISMFKFTDNITVLCSPNYDKICPEIYKQFLSILKDKLNIDRVNENTLVLLSDIWQRNYLLNLKHVVKDNSIRRLEKATSSPVVIASGGPSLTKQLPLIKKFREKFILIASGSTINTLLSDNIVPDFVVSIDGSFINYEHYKDINNSEIILLYGMYNHNKIRDIFDNGYYFLNQRHTVLLNHMKRIIGEEPIVMEGGGSVAHHALIIANYLTSGPIALVGQDLAYTNNLSHAENNKGRFEISDDIKKTKIFIKAEGYYGDEVLTDYPFLSMKKAFEKLIKILQNKNIYNCTEGGIRLEGYTQIPFVDFCSKFTNEKANKEFLLNKKNNCTEKLKKLEELKKHMQEELETFDELIKTLKNSLNLLSKNKNKTSFEQKILQKLDINDKKIENYINKTSLGVVLDPINLKIIKSFSPKKDETVEETYQRVYEQNKVLYSEYIIAANKTKKYIKELINDINNEIEVDNDESKYYRSN